MIARTWRGVVRDLHADHSEVVGVTDR